MDGIHGTELLVWAAEQAAHPAWEPAWSAVAFLGAPVFFSIALPLLYAFAPSRLALRLTLAFALATATSEWVKAVVDRPRIDPLAFGLAGPLEDPKTYASAAFPSGHVLVALVLWGTVAVHTRSRSVRAVCGLLIVAIAASRLALLRHDLLDIAGGLGIGALLLVLLVRAERSWGDSLAALPRVERAGAWILGALAMQALAGLESTAVVLGVGAGLGAGATLAAERKRRDGPPGLLRGAMRAVLGLGGVAVVRWIAEPGQGWGPAWLLVLYGAAAVWISGILPLFTGGVYERPRASD